MGLGELTAQVATFNIELSWGRGSGIPPFYETLIGTIGEGGKGLTSPGLRGSRMGFSVSGGFIGLCLAVVHPYQTMTHFSTAYSI